MKMESVQAERITFTKTLIMIAEMCVTNCSGITKGPKLSHYFSNLCVVSLTGIEWKVMKEDWMTDAFTFMN